VLDPQFSDSCNPPTTRTHVQNNASTYKPRLEEKFKK